MGTATYCSDLAGRLVEIDDWMNGNQQADPHVFAYDDLNRLTRYTDYDDEYIEYEYDDAGNVVTFTDYEGNDTTYAYTDLGQLDTITAPGSKVWVPAFAGMT